MSGRKGESEPPVQVEPDSHLAYLLARVNHQLQRRMDRALQTQGITPTQFYALAHIARSPGLSSADLARSLLTTPQAVATLLKRLEAAGFIEREPAARGLSGASRLTPGGTRKLRSVISVAVPAEAAALSVISAADQRRVTTILQSLLDGLERSTIE